MRLFLCYVCPPLAVLFMGRPLQSVLNFFLTSLFWMPGVRHALACYAEWKFDNGIGQVTSAIHNPKWAQPQPEPRQRRAEVQTVVVYDNPHVGRGGTYFRKRGD